MMKTVPLPVKTISLLGILPFFLGILATLNVPIFSNDYKDLIVDMTILYAALILSFLGGIIFGFEVLSSRLFPGKLFLSICPTIWAFTAVNLPNFSASLLAIGFLLVYEIERRTNSKVKTPDWWLALRLPLTTVVIIALAVIGFNG